MQSRALTRKADNDRRSLKSHFIVASSSLTSMRPNYTMASKKFVSLYLLQCSIMLTPHDSLGKVGIRLYFQFISSSGFLHRRYSVFLPFQVTQRIL